MKNGQKRHVTTGATSAGARRHDVAEQLPKEQERIATSLLFIALLLTGSTHSLASYSAAAEGKNRSRRRSQPWQAHCRRRQHSQGWEESVGSTAAARLAAEHLRPAGPAAAAGKNQRHYLKMVAEATQLTLPRGRHTSTSISTDDEGEGRGKMSALMKAVPRKIRPLQARQSTSPCKYRSDPLGLHCCSRAVQAVPALDVLRLAQRSSSSQPTAKTNKASTHGHAWIYAPLHGIYCHTASCPPETGLGVRIHTQRTQRLGSSSEPAAAGSLRCPSATSHEQSRLGFEPPSVHSTLSRLVG